MNTGMEAATFDEVSCGWTIMSDDGRVWSARYLIVALGQLSLPEQTVYPGQEEFGGRIIYSAQWPRESIDFAGKRVAIVGTGSSDVQMTPILAEQAARLAVFQRTANHSIPAVNAPLSDEEDRQIKANYHERREAARNSPGGLGFVPNGSSALDAPPEEREIAYEAAWKRLGFGFALTYKDTGSLLKPDVTGRGGLTLWDKWSAGPVSFFGIGVNEFSNMFILVGPGSPSLLSNGLLSAEEQIDWLIELIDHDRTHGIDEVEATAEAERDWVAHVNERAKETLYIKTPSYYLGAEIPGKPQVFMPYSGGVRGYRRIILDVAEKGYEGFARRRTQGVDA